MGSCAAPSAKGDDKFITTDYLQQCHIRYGFIFNGENHIRYDFMCAA
nr:replication initiator protein [Escherichia coli]MDN1387546.1 replication initiator protein [Escherichia coli]